MLNKIISKRILNSLKNYISIDEEKDFIFELWNGKLEMNNLKLKNQKFKDFQINGNVGNLSINIPWKNIINGYIETNISNIDIFITHNQNLLENKEIQIENKELKIGYFERKITEKILLKIDDLKIQYKNYIFSIKNIEINEQKRFNFDEIIFYKLKDEKKIKIFQKFSARGSILENIINFYIDEIKINISSHEIKNFIFDLKPFLNLIKNNSIKKENIKESNEELEKFLEIKQTKIVDTDKNIKIKFAIDNIKFKIINQHSIFYIKLTETFFDNSENFKISTNFSKDFLGNFLMENDQIFIQNLHLNLLDFLVKFSFPKEENDIFLQNLNLFKNTFHKSILSFNEFSISNSILEINELKLDLNNEILEIPKFSLNFKNKKFYFDKIIMNPDLCQFLFFSRKYFHFIMNYYDILSYSSQNMLNDDKNNSYDLSNEIFEMKFDYFVCYSGIEIKNLLISTQNNISLKKDKNPTEPEGNSNDQIIKKDSFNLIFSFENARIGTYEYENFYKILNLKNLFHFKYLDFKFLQIYNLNRNYIEKIIFDFLEIDEFLVSNKNNLNNSEIVSENNEDNNNFNYTNNLNNLEINSKSNSKSNLKIDSEFNSGMIFQIKKIKLIYDHLWVQEIKYLKNILYSIINFEDTESENNFIIKIKEIEYKKESIFLIKNLNYENKSEILFLEIFYENLICKLFCDLKNNKIDIKLNGNINQNIFTVLLREILYFSDIFLEILNNPFFTKNSSELLINIFLNVKLKDLKCERNFHCLSNYELISNFEFKKSEILNLKSNNIFLRNLNFKNEYLKIDDFNLFILEIENGFKIDFQILKIINKINLHKLLILKEKIILPDLKMMGPSKHLSVNLRIKEIFILIKTTNYDNHNNNDHNQETNDDLLEKVLEKNGGVLEKVLQKDNDVLEKNDHTYIEKDNNNIENNENLIYKFIANDFHLEDSKIKCNLKSDTLSMQIFIKIKYSLANSISISLQNILMNENIENIFNYKKLYDFLYEETKTEFEIKKLNQYNLIFNEGELFLHKEVKSQKILKNNKCPCLRIYLKKFLFFIPGTSSFQFSIFIFNPKILDYQIFLEECIFFIFFNDIIKIETKSLNFNLQKEILEIFENHQDFVVKIENFMKNQNVNFDGQSLLKYVLNSERENVSETTYPYDSQYLLKSHSESDQKNSDNFKNNEKNIFLHNLKSNHGMIISKLPHSTKHSFSIKDKKINIDLTNNILTKKIVSKLPIIFSILEINNFTRKLTFLNQIYFKNYLSYNLNILIGNKDFQEEEILLKNELSFNTKHDFLRIKMNHKVSAESFQFSFQNINFSKSIILEKSIQIQDKIINIKLDIENIQNLLFYSIFFYPHSFIFNETKNKKIFFNNSTIKKEYFLEKNEIVSNDCFSYSDEIYLHNNSNCNFQNKFENNASDNENKFENNAYDNTDKKNIFEVNKFKCKCDSISFTKTPLNITHFNKEIFLTNIFIIHPNFIIKNSINEEIKIDNLKIKKGKSEINIKKGILRLNDKNIQFDFKVMNILNELENKYIFSMDTLNYTIPFNLFSNNSRINSNNSYNYSDLFYEQKVIEIKYSYIIHNLTKINLTVNNVFFKNNDFLPIEMKNKNILKINKENINLIKCPYFKIKEKNKINFYTIKLGIIEKQKIMKLIESESPIIIFNKFERTILINNEYFIKPNEKLEFLDQENEVKIKFNKNKKEYSIKRVFSEKVKKYNLEILSVQRGNKEFIYVGNNLEKENFEEKLKIDVKSMKISLFMGNKEFLNFYFKNLEIVRKIDPIDLDKKNVAYSLTLRGFQIDNQDYKAFFPIIMHPVMPQFYYFNDVVNVDQYFLAFTIECNEEKLMHQIMEHSRTLNQDKDNFGDRDVEDNLNTDTDNLNDNFNTDIDNVNDNEYFSGLKELSLNFLYFAIHEFELNIEEDVLEQIYSWLPTGKSKYAFFFHLFHISPINLRLSLQLSKQNKKKFFKKMIKAIISNCSEVRMSFKSLTFSQFSLNNEILINSYKIQLLNQLLSLIGSLDILGNISSLVEELSLGVHDLFYEPYIGFKEDDLLHFTTGILKGGRNFTAYFLKGVTNSISKIGKTISFQKKRKEILFYDPLLIDISKDFLENVVEGISGIITKPVSGAKKKGFKGFLKGVGAGITGVFTKPIAGISNFVADINEDLKTSLDGIELRRVQYPRPFLEIYNLEKCQSYFLFLIFVKNIKNYESNYTEKKDEKKLKYFDENSEYFIDGEIGFILDVKAHLILTNKRLIIMNNSHNFEIKEFEIISYGIQTRDFMVRCSERFIENVRMNL